MQYQQQDNFFNMVNLMSLFLGYQNLIENEQQSAYNDVHAANDKQAKFLLQEIDKRFREQNTILEKQNEMLEKLIDLLTKEVK